MFKSLNNKQKVDLGLGIFFIILSAIEFVMHNSVIDLIFGFLFLLAGIIRLVFAFKRAKKIIFYSTIILIGVAALYLYRNSGYYATQKVYSAINHPNKLRKICDNEHTYSYLLKNKGKRIQLSDNQGSRNIFYYPGYYGKQEISLTGEFIPFDLKIKRITLHK